MPIFDNEFTCPNGHTFKANAKLRTRCPECGSVAKMDFTKPKEEPKEPKVEPKEPETKPKETESKKPVLVRQGRPRIMPKSPEPKAKNTMKKPSVKVKKPSVGKTVSGLVKTKRISVAGSTPTVRKPPKRTAIARHISTPGKESFLDSVVRRYGPS